jgi:hypothetical protein
LLKPVNNYFSRFICYTLFSFQGTFFEYFRTLGGLKWTRTTDLTLIRRAL